MSLVLVVDDEPDIRVVVRSILRACGHDVCEASTGEDALEVLKRTEPDVVLLDIRLPGISGVDVLKRIRSAARFDRVAVVMLSAHSSETIAAECGDLGCQGFIRKPFNNSDLVAAVADAAPTTSAAGSSTKT